MRTIRNCQSTTNATCPQLWDQLIPEENPTVRRCDRCEHLVYFCANDRGKPSLITRKLATVSPGRSRRMLSWGRSLTATNR